MNPLKAVATKLYPTVSVAGLQLKKHSPEIYLAGGIFAGIAAAVMLAKAHKKSEEVFGDYTEQLDILKAQPSAEEMRDMPQEELDANEFDIEDAWFETERQKKMALAMQYRYIAVDAVKLYGPGILMGAGSIALILASHGVLRGRNKALGAAVAITQQGFNIYRQRVVAELGAEADERFYYGAEARSITTLETTEDGKNKKVKGAANHMPEELPDPIMYGRWYTNTNINWFQTPDQREFWLRAVEKQMNDQLYLRGYVMLNSVYKALGFDETPEGAVVGWAKKAHGDDFIDFGLDRDINQRQGDERWFLDFNVNGVVFELIGE